MRACLPTSETSGTASVDLCPISCIVHLFKRIPTMRKIERLMNDAISESRDWGQANTRVEMIDGVSVVFLHGNKIAEVGDDFVRVFDGGWQSNTTKSRLNAIINEFCDPFTDGVYQHKFEWFITDNKNVHKFVNGYTFTEESLRLAQRQYAATK